jgi:hypothetical protein
MSTARLDDISPSAWLNNDNPHVARHQNDNTRQARMFAEGRQ